MLVPAVGVWVDASVDTNAWVVKLADPLVRTLQWQTVKGVSVATVSGQVLRALVEATSTMTLNGDGEPASHKKQKTEEADDGTASRSLALTTTNTNTNTTTTPTGSSSASALLPILTLVDNVGSARRSQHHHQQQHQQPLHVGDVRLTELRKSLQARGHSADFQAEGTLVVDGRVVVRKGSAGRVEIETSGAPSATFYEIRRMVYDALAVIGA